ncbi:hypothetical protein [Limnobaculum xujianqingii]|uniref:hypothetical protein n=1 Tax=Limnobaculum xujianqingii TaxID=2738837 RepID=UPI00112CF0F7|nr:hypothetical protein [Limnobaculum xujianqingii]
MAYETPNAVKSVAKRCAKALKEANSTAPEITRPIILKHYEEIAALNVKFGLLALTREVGVINGQFKER